MPDPLVRTSLHRFIGVIDCANNGSDAGPYFTLNDPLWRNGFPSWTDTPNPFIEIRFDVAYDLGVRRFIVNRGIVAHEYFHGVTERLTGGPADLSSLNSIQSGGMGEGWSDWFALLMTSKPGDTAGTPRTIGNGSPSRWP